MLAEAREAGCAIVATAVGGVPEVLEHGRAGVLVAPGDAAALATALDRLLADGTARADLRRRATENIRWLSCARMAAETIAVYREALDRVRHASAHRHSPGRAYTHHWNRWRR